MPDDIQMDGMFGVMKYEYLNDAMNEARETKAQRILLLTIIDYWCNMYA